MKWKRSGKAELPTHGMWWLREITIEEGNSWMMFARRTGKGDDHRIELITLMLKNGRAWPVRAGQRQSMKHERRVRVTNLANQAVAYVMLMGHGDDFPPQAEI